ncbi:MAG: hypothetical protein Q6K80_11925 [Thermostichus sp. DG_1_6_bins_120]
MRWGNQQRTVQLSWVLSAGWLLGLAAMGGSFGQANGSAHAQTLFPAASPPPRVIYRLQPPSSPQAEPVVEQPIQDPAPWRPVEPEAVVDPVEPAPELEEGPVFNLDLLQQFGTGPGGRGSGSRQGEGIGPGTGQGGGRGSSPGSGLGAGQGPGGGTGLEAGAQQRQPQVTGLIVDARGLDFLPSQSMRLFDPDGNQVYTPLNLNQDLNAAFVGSEGTAAYATSEEQARSLVNRIGERPHYIRAIRTLGYDLVISAEDAFGLRQMNATDGFLDAFAVVVIWDGNQARLP